MADVFISYKKEDRKRTELIATALRTHQLTVWWDESLGGGQAFRDQIEYELSVAGATIVIWSDLSIKSSFVLDEASDAQNHNKLLPVTFDKGVVPPMGFRQTQVLDLSDWSGDAQDPRFLSVVRGVDRLRAARFGHAVKHVGDAVATSIADQKPALGKLGAGSQATLSSMQFLEIFGLPLYRLFLGSAVLALFLAALEFVGRIMQSLPTAQTAAGAVLGLFAFLIIRCLHQVATIISGKSSRQFFDSAFTFWTILSAILTPLYWVLTTRDQITPPNFLANFPDIALTALGVMITLRLLVAASKRLVQNLS